MKEKDKAEILKFNRIVSAMVQDFIDSAKKRTKRLDGRTQWILIARALNSVFWRHYGLSMKVAEDHFKKVQDSMGKDSK